jgi:hypothetical protein
VGFQVFQVTPRGDSKGVEGEETHQDAILGHVCLPQHDLAGMIWSVSPPHLEARKLGFIFSYQVVFD